MYSLTRSARRRFCLLLQAGLVLRLENEKPLYYLHNSLAPKIMSVEPEPKFQAPVPPPESFRLRIRFQRSKIAWAPTGQCAMAFCIASAYQY